METMVRTAPCKTRPASHSTAIHTTLYDLIAALSAEVGPEEEDVLTATVVHLLNAYRVTCTGDLEGYRLVCGVTGRLPQSAPTQDDVSAHLVC